MYHLAIISHDATRTGAPILLLNLARALEQDNQLSVSFLLKHGGPLQDAFAKLAPVHFATVPPTAVVKIARRVPYVRRFAQPAFSEKAVQSAIAKADVVLSNTITNGDLLPLVRKYFKGPIVSYIHELEMASKFFTQPSHITNLLQETDHFVVPSKAVGGFLQSAYAVQPGKISLLNYFIPGFEAAKNDRAINKKIFTIGASGTNDWRKGPDFFIAIAKQVMMLAPEAELRFTWKGAVLNSLEMERLQYDINKANLKDIVSFLPAGDDMAAFYQNIDLFLCCSREDPYPLVVLEAAAASVPSICFRESGGAVEFIEDDAGTAVGYLDLAAAAQAILRYYRSPELCRAHGHTAFVKWQQRHQNASLVNNQFHAVVEKLIPNAS